MASKGLSSNPTLAAIQRAKQEAAAQQKANANNNSSNNNVRASSLDVARSTSLSSHASITSVPITSVGSPPASWTPRAASNAAAASFKHLDEDERSMLREGWWAKTDAGNMNVEEVKWKELLGAGPSYAASATLGLAKKLDFAAMLQDAAPDEASAKAPAAAAAQAVPPPAAAVPAAKAVCAPDAAGAVEEPAPTGTPVLGSSAAKKALPGAGDDSDDKSWWKKMDNKDLNEADVHDRAKGGAKPSAFTPQFVGSSGLTHKLDFTGGGSS